MKFLEIFAFIIFLTTIGVLLTMYIEGYFSYQDFIIEKTKHDRTTSKFPFNTNNKKYFYRIVIERRYENGRIKFITKEINI
jgi:Gpi18-like mannosyltransferase